MIAYLIRRLILMIPTLFGIMAINFAAVQFAHGGPVERIPAQLSGLGSDVSVRTSRGSGPGNENQFSDKYRVETGLDPSGVQKGQRQRIEYAPYTGWIS